MTPEEIFSQIIEHMIKGLMVHEQLANYYDFLGLQGYKKCHEYHFFEESKTYRKMYHYYIKKYNRLLPETRFENPEVIPKSWLNYYRQDVDMKTKKNAIEIGLNEWIQWETDTTTLYQRLYKELMDCGEVAAAAMLQKVICDVEEELQTVEKYQLNKISMNYDMTEIIGEQKAIHKKYCCKIKEV